MSQWKVTLATSKQGHSIGVDFLVFYILMSRLPSRSLTFIYIYIYIYITYSIYVFPDMVRHYDDNEMSRVRHIDSLKYV